MQESNKRSGCEMHLPSAHIQDSWAMPKRITRKNRDIIRSVRDVPGQTFAQIVDHFSGIMNETTVRRNLYKLGALGYLSLRDEIAVYPTEKGKKLMSRASSTQGEVH